MNLELSKNNTIERYIKSFIKEYPTKFNYEVLESNIIEYIIDNNKIVGIVGYVYGDTLNDIFVNMIYILPEHRRKGHFKETVHMLKQKYYYIRINLANEELLPTFLKYGFKIYKTKSTLKKIIWAKDDIK